jgi:cell division protein FtsZ
MLFDIPKEEKSIIKVLGVGGGGSNAVVHMYKQGITGVDFAIGNTDRQAMENAEVPIKIHLGPHLTGGRGAGSRPQIGKQACIESIDDIRKFLEDGTKMLFVTAGMGGGTGTGAAPIIAKAAREMDILTVGIVTLPFTFEGRRRARHALEGLEEMKANVDSLIVISNDKLREIHGNLGLSDAFGEADDILTTAARGIAEIITVPGYINVDFEDVNTVMRDSGVAIMGTAIAEGENRARIAVEDALNSPLLEDNDIRGAQHILLNITSGTKEVTMDEIGEITEYVQDEAGYGTDLIWGNCLDESMGEKISVTIIATGFESGQKKEKKKEVEKIIVPLEEDHLTQEVDTDMFISDPIESKQQAPTYEFDDVQNTIDKLRGKNYTYKEPYIKLEEKARMEEAKRRKMEREAIRREQQRTYNVVSPNKLDNSDTIADLTNEPAYLRRNVDLEDVASAAEINASRWTISGEEEPEMREDNRFFSDNVD